MKKQLFSLSSLLAALLIGGMMPSHATVTADGVVSIDAAATPGSILSSIGSVDLALNLGATSGATINGISFTGAALAVGTPVVGAGATITANTPTGTGTTLRNLDLNGFLWTTSGAFAGVMNDAVDSNRFPAQAGDALNFTISGLDANRFYFIQLLSGDTRTENEDQAYSLGGVVQNAQFGNGGSNDGALIKFTATGETTLTLSVSRNAGNSPPMLAGILIRSVAPGLFGPATTSGTSAGLPTTLAVQIGNAAASSYQITGASFTGPNASEFSNGSTLPLSVPALGSSNYTVNFTPTMGGTRTATLTLNTDDPAVPTITVSLSVIVSDPVIVIDSSVAFGNSVDLPGPVTSDIFVDNNGAATNLIVSSPAISGAGAAAFSVTRLPNPIAPGSSDTVEVTFHPIAPGYYAAALELTTNAPFTPTVTIQLRGEVTGTLISPVTVASVSSENLFGLNRDANNTINNSGLSGLGSAGSTHGNSEESVVWTSNGNIAAPNDLAPQITYDLGAIHHVTKIREWGYNSNFQVGSPPVNLAIIGPKQVEVFTSIDNANFTSAGTVNFALATGTANYAGNEIPLALPAARYIRLVIKSNHDGAIFDGTGATPGTKDARGLTGLSEIKFEGTISPFELWLDDYALLGAARAPNADPENDGSTNLIEYVTGGDPTVSDTNKLPQSEVVGGNVNVTFARPDTVSGVVIRYEVGTDLMVWPDIFTVGASPNVTITPNSSAPDTISLTLPMIGQPKRFFRLSAELSP